MYFLGQSFRIENAQADPSLKYTVRNRGRRAESNTSRGSTSNDSDGSVEGTYNFAVEDDDIDEQMFAGDRNSASLARAHDPRLRYLDPAVLSHEVSLSSGDDGNSIRLQNYQPKGSPVAPPRNGNTVYASVDASHNAQMGTNAAERDLENLKGQNPYLTNVPKDSTEVSSSDEDDIPPNWIPPPPPVTKYDPLENSQKDNDHKDQIAVPDSLVKGATDKSNSGSAANGLTTNESSSSDDDDDSKSRLAVHGNERPLYSQVDPSKKKKKKSREGASESCDRTENGISTNGSSSDAETSEDDSVNWPPPPPPPQRLSNLPDDSDWERPLPPDIMALPGKRNRFAAWADDES